MDGDDHQNRLSSMGQALFKLADNAIHDRLADLPVHYRDITGITVTLGSGDIVVAEALGDDLKVTVFTPN